MQPEETRLQDVQAWLSEAELDLKAAAHEISAPAEALWGDVMFHAQQAAEKAMKAFLAWHDAPFRQTHNLEELGQRCVMWVRRWPLSPIRRRHSPSTRGSSGAEAGPALAAARPVGEQLNKMCTG